MVYCGTVSSSARSSDIGRASRSALTFYRVRRDLRLKQADMAKLLRVSQVTLSQIENGKVIPKESAIRELRDLAFANRLAFAHEIYPEIDSCCPYCGK